MTRIKICGITNRDDMQAAVEYGTDALGFIAVPGSPRFIPDELYQDIASVPPFLVKRIIVVNKPEDAERYSPDYIQHYGETTDRSCSTPCGAHWRIRAFRVRDEASLRELANYPDAVGAVLLDTYHKDMLGGSGEIFDWRLAIEAKRLTDKPLILAGGLTPENVQDALEAVRPYAVDVSSGVESAPGVKDHAKLRAFIQAVRAWDLRR